MVKIRMRRLGKKFNPIYQIVVADERFPRDGRFIEKIGFYNPKSKEIKINNELRQKWHKNGAKPSETVKNLFKNYDKNDGQIICKAKKPKPKSKD